MTPHASFRLSSLFALLLTGSQLAAVPAAASELPYPFQLAAQPVAPGSRHLVATNSGYAPVQVTLRDTTTASLDAGTGTWSMVIPANSRIDLSRQLPAGWRGKPGKLGYKWSIGAPAHQDPAAVYQLPFASSQPVLVSQAFGGRETTHNTPQSRYAIDFSMPRGTPILAARDGTVVLAVDGYGEGGPDAQDLARANMVEILHKDGTLAEYVHLLKDHVYVHPGQVVHAGQAIALSGNSGFSSAPHLHFGVQQKVGTQNLSIPVAFRAATGQVFQPRFGEYLAN